MTDGTEDAALVWETLARFPDAATARFEAVLGAADIDPATARALRFWHAEAVHGVKRYAAEAVPAVLAAVDRAAAEVAAAARRAELTWAEAGRPVPEAPDPAVAAAASGTAEPPAPPAVVVLPDAAEEPGRTVSLRLAELG